MNDNEKKSGDWKVIVGGILLIAVLFAGIKFIFWGLGEAIHKNHPETYQSASVSSGVSSADQSGQEAPSFCVHCGKELPESFEWGQFCPYCGEKVES